MNWRFLRSRCGAGTTPLRTFVTAIVPDLIRVMRRVLGANHPDVEDTPFEGAGIGTGAPDTELAGAAHDNRSTSAATRAAFVRRVDSS
jgi:hypothetical protein